MNQTIIGQFYLSDDEELEDTTEYLKQLGMTFQQGIKNVLFYIEFKKIPEILFKLEQKGYFNYHRHKTWDILKISDKGVLLYICAPHGDGYVFLPKENIISIHTIYDDFLDAFTLNHRLDFPQ